MSQLSQERTNPSLRIEPVRKRLGYLSGAARVTTRGDATASGPRAHVLGCMSGFRSLGWDVRPFIYGDRIPVKMTNEAGRYMRANRLNGMTADVARMALRHLNRRRALREVGDVDWVYERFASFQSLGKPFQDRGAGWILET